MVWTAKEVMLECESKRRLARMLFERDGGHMTIAFFFASKGDDNQILIVPQMEGCEKDDFAVALRAVGSDPHVSGSMMIMEAWYARILDHKEVLKWAGRVSLHPERKEALHLMLEHPRTGKKGWQAEITRDAEGRPTLGEWTEQDGAPEGGRFVGLVPETS